MGQETAVAVNEPPSEGERQWYVLKVQSNRERSIRDNLVRRIHQEGLDEFFGEIVIPTEKVVETKGGKKRITEHKLFPGYLMVQMVLNDETWYLVRSTSGVGLLTTFAGSMSTPGANTIYGKGPMFVVIGPEHAATLKRDGFTIESIRQELFMRSRVHASRISDENQATYINTGHKPDGDWFTIGRTPEDIHITVAGGPGKHSAFIPSFGGTTVACTRIAP